MLFWTVEPNTDLKFHNLNLCPFLIKSEMLCISAFVGILFLNMTLLKETILRPFVCNSAFFSLLFGLKDQRAKSQLRKEWQKEKTPVLIDNAVGNVLE